MQTLGAWCGIVVSSGLFLINPFLKVMRQNEGEKKRILAGFKEKKMNSRNIKTSQFREEVFLFSLIKEELGLLLPWEAEEL